MLDLLQGTALNLWYIVLVAVFFGGSIFVHELGHFLAARWRGLKIDRFSIGFGPKIISWTRNGVEYRLSWIPLGGYVALPQLSDMRGIEGEPATDADKLPILSYTDKMIVSVMGAVFNVIFAFMLACVLWLAKQPANEYESSTTIGSLDRVVRTTTSADKNGDLPGPAFAAGLAQGDRIVRIDDHETHDWQDVVNGIVMGNRWTEDGRRLAVFAVERDGAVLEKAVHPLAVGDDEIRYVGIMPAFGVVVQAVVSGSLAAQVGLKPDDRMISLGGEKIFNSSHFIELFTRRRDRATELVVRRGRETIALSIPAQPGSKITGIRRNSIAHRIGLRIDDWITAVEGQPVQGSTQLRELLATTTGDFHLTVLRGNETLTMVVPARTADTLIGVEFANLFGATLVPQELPMVRVSPLEQCVKVVRNAYRALKSFVDPGSDVGLNVASGPIEIVRVYHMVAQDGLRAVLAFTLLINISLALFNVLPIPVLDGGHMLFATITKLRKRPLSTEFLVRTQSVFMVLLLTMVVYVSYFNVRRWVNDAGRGRVDDSIIRTNEELAARPADASASSPSP